MTPIPAATPDVVSLLEQMNTSPGTRHTATALRNSVFSVLVHKDHQKQFAFSEQGQQYTFTVLPQEYISSLGLGHNLVQRDLHCPVLLQNIILAFYIDGTLLTGPNEQGVVTT